MACSSSSSFQLSSLQIQTPPLKKSNFLGQSHNLNIHTKSTLKPSSTSITTAKFNLYEILGGRGLCNGEEGIQKELKKSISEEQSSAKSATDDNNNNNNQEKKETGEFPEDGFEKEMMGLVGGFPGGEKGLKKFIEQNPPPKKTESRMEGFNLSLVKKPKPPELPLLLPGMIAIVKNSNNPYYMYCGIVQRITDGKAAVLFEGGNWDRLISFRLEELERREKGPPMVNPRSAILETMLEKSSEA
ncbi:NAD(P)H-quinone oxidoreductase subunit S, chloroplastic-like [Nicotiana tabacum]|uniref:NAD(P)H-quinone oxidoreductase subunit S, chloroplastic-like n=1 Tax=Nicotiana tabacum TaxID=4097 RepID=A0A1S4BTJ3_TOBAC|nr:PREDICTED: NAD(P)H-quinone oxidoreductase subunit S, chloroplastic-like [Nicotiana tabacum]